MTPAERADHRILNGSRRSRIARGSGTSVSDVNGLVERFTEAQKMMRQMAAGGAMPGIPGIPGMGGGKKAKGKMTAKGSGKKAKGGRSGNPAKRAIEAQQHAQRVAAGGVAGDGAGALDLPEDFELPEELRNLLPPGQR
jgi:signal recognition particle subunit SRP54